MSENKAVFSFGYKRSPDQDASTPARHPVIVVGAGPVGLAASIDLAQRGVPVVLLDDSDRIGEGSRGICYSKRCLEILDTLGVGEKVVAQGVRWQVGKVYFRQKLVNEFNLLAEDGHKMPAFVNLQQYYLEKLLVERAEGVGIIDLRWRNRVMGILQSNDGAILQIDTPDGPYQLAAEWVVAADGARSTIRGLMNLPFIGETFQDRFLIADITMAADFPPERRFWFEPPFHDGQSTLLHKQPDDVWRVDFQIGWDSDPDEETKPEKVRARLDRMLEGRDYELEWVSVYTFQCRRIERFVHGRVVFAGDAAHQVSPFGARGGNSGIEDAANLAWKLALILKGKAPPALLESYDVERTQAADENIGHSTRATDFLVPKSEGAAFLRNAVLDLSEHLEFPRRMLNSGRLHTSTHYDSPLTTPDEDEFATGTASPGCPAPDAPLVGARQNKTWLLNTLSPGFNLIYSDDGSRPAVADDVSLLAIGDEFREEASHFSERYGATPGACWLVRPDHYIAGRWRRFEASKVEAALSRATSSGTSLGGRVSKARTKGNTL